MWNILKPRSHDTSTQCYSTHLVFLNRIIRVDSFIVQFPSFHYTGGSGDVVRRGWTTGDEQGWIQKLQFPMMKLTTVCRPAQGGLSKLLSTMQKRSKMLNTMYNKQSCKERHAKNEIALKPRLECSWQSQNRRIFCLCVFSVAKLDQFHEKKPQQTSGLPSISFMLSLILYRMCCI